MEKNKFHWSWSSFFLGIIVISLGKVVYQEAKLDALALEADLSSTGNHRSPASIKKTFDYSSLAGMELQKAAKRRLLDSLRVEQEADNAVIELGNFVLLNDLKEKDFACGYFDHVTFRFQAEGVAVEGEKPTLIVEAPCEVGEDNINVLNPIKIPFKKIRGLKPAEQELQFSDAYLSRPGAKLRGPSSGGYSLRIQMANAPADWPSKWLLTDVKMTHVQAAYRKLHISQEEIDELTNKPILMNW